MIIDPVESLVTFLDEVDHKLKAFGEKAEAALGQAQVTTHLGLMEAEQAWAKKKDEVLAALSQLRQAQAKPEAALEDGRIELYFGKEDAKAAVERLWSRLEATEISIKELGAEANADTKAALARLTEAYESIKDKLLH